MLPVNPPGVVCCNWFVGVVCCRYSFCLVLLFHHPPCVAWCCCLVILSAQFLPVVQYAGSALMVGYLLQYALVLPIVLNHSSHLVWYVSAAQWCCLLHLWMVHLLLPSNHLYEVCWCCYIDTVGAVCWSCVLMLTPDLVGEHLVLCCLMALQWWGEYCPLAL